MKRILGFLLALVMLSTMFAVQAPAVYAQNESDTPGSTAQDPAAQTEGAESDEDNAGAEKSEEETPKQDSGHKTFAPETTMHFSDDALEILKHHEGFSRYPYKDYLQWTVGYGTKCPEDKRAEYTANGISKEDAEALLRKYIDAFEGEANRYKKRHNLTWTQGQYDAVVSFSYNVGTAWMYESNSTIRGALENESTDNEVIRAFGLWSKAGGQVLTALLRRRLVEANMYLNNAYEKSAPSNYGYVKYNGNGGKVSYSAQAYCCDTPAEIINTVVLDGFEFTGWYTAAVGGEKVTQLTADVKSKTLYAHWSNGETEEEEGKLDVPIKVTVTENGVNLRKGPGTNYGKIGMAYKGDTKTITHTAVGGQYNWGYYGSGWICLKYTNFDKLYAQLNPPQSSESAPESSSEPVPESSSEPVPESSTQPVPESSSEPVPETSTQPAPEPEPEPEPEVKPVMGTVKVTGNNVLRVRKGPSTGYAVVKSLKNGARVEILEQKTVGSVVWGRVSDGWLSMDYIKLDPAPTPETPSQPDEKPQTQTGKVTSSSLYVRQKAGTSYKIVTTLWKGDKVTITETTTVSGVQWGKVSKGWICLKYVALDTPAPVPTPEAKPDVTPEPTPEEKPPVTTEPENSGSGEDTPPVQTPETYVTGKIKVTGSLRIRAGKGTSYKILGYYYNKDKIKIYEQDTVGGTTWGRTDKGWISMAYVTLDKPATDTNTTPAKVTKTVTADCLVVRKGAGTSYKVVSYLYRGAKVVVLEQKTVSGLTWGRVSNGWICLKYTK